MFWKAIKPSQLVGQAALPQQTSSLSPSLKFEPLPDSACHLAIAPKAVPEGNQSSWGSSLALLGLVGHPDWRAHTQGVSELASVAAGSLEENMLPLLLH